MAKKVAKTPVKKPASKPPAKKEPARRRRWPMVVLGFVTGILVAAGVGLGAVYVMLGPEAVPFASLVGLGTPPTQPVPYPPPPPGSFIPPDTQPKPPDTQPKPPDTPPPATTQDWLHLTDIVLSSEAPSDDVRVIVNADGARFVIPGDAEWVRPDGSLRKEKFLLPPGTGQHRVSFEVLGKDGAKYVAAEPVAVVTPSGERKVELFQERKPGVRSEVPEVWVKFDIRPPTKPEPDKD